MHTLNNVMYGSQVMMKVMSVHACMQTLKRQIIHLGCVSCSWQVHAGLDSKTKHVCVCATGEAEARHRRGACQDSE